MWLMTSGEMVAMLSVREGEVFRAHNWLRSQTEAVWKGLFRWPKPNSSEQPCLCRARADGLAMWLCDHTLSLQTLGDLLLIPETCPPGFCSYLLTVRFLLKWDYTPDRTCHTCWQLKSIYAFTPHNTHVRSHDGFKRSSEHDRQSRWWEAEILRICSHWDHTDTKGP